MDKVFLRKFQKEKILKIYARDKEAQICNSLAKILSNAHSVIIYKSIQFEIDLSECETILQKSAKIYYPRIKGEKLEFVNAVSWTFGKFSIPEPVGSELILPEFVDFCVVPSLGFNQRGYRLGRGGGFYDKSLKNTSSEKIIGVGFRDAFPVEFEEEPHDIRIGRLVTDKEIIFFRNCDILKADNIKG